MNNSVLDTQEHFISCPSLRTIDLTHKTYSSTISQIYPHHQFFTQLFSKLKKSIDTNSSHQVALAISKVSNTDDVSSIILEILLARKYRSGKREEAHPADVYSRIAAFVKNNEKIELHISMFPCKIPNPLKSAGTMPDLAEIISLSRLIEICSAIEKVYPPGARFTILPDGRRFLDIANFPLHRVVDYQLQLLQYIYELGGKQKVICLDYADLIEMLKPADKKRMEKVKHDYYEEYKKMFGLLSDNHDFATIVAHIKEREATLSADAFGKKFFALFHSLLYTVYHPEIMELDGLARDIRALVVYKDIFSPADDPAVHDTRRSLLQRTWNAAIGYVTNISTIRLINPSDAMFPHAIRFDMHNIPGRIGLYTLYRSTKYTPFHTTGFIDEDGQMKVNFRVNLHNEDYIQVSGIHYNSAFKNQPFMYIHRSLKHILEDSPEQLVEFITFRP